MTHTRTNFDRPTIGLCMIVKNEAQVICRCLDSVKSIISHWLVVDTGSTDGTQDLIREHLRDIPGRLEERPWCDFAHNRSEALVLARPYTDYILVIDADDCLVMPTDFHLPQLTADGYTLDILDNGLRYPRLQLLSNQRPWYYRGVLHEFPVCDETVTQQHLAIAIQRGHDGARRRDPATYQRDAALLEQALNTEADELLRRRYTFYLAQSYRDCGELALAIAKYQQRAALGGWSEEVYYSYYQAAVLMEATSQPYELILSEYQAATDTLPERVEARYGASRLCRLQGDYARGYAIAKPGLNQAPPPHALFVQTWIYETGLRDEFAVNAYWAGHYAECLEISLLLIDSKKLPTNDVPRVLGNARAAGRELARLTAPTMCYRPCTAGVIKDTGTAKGRGVFAIRAIAAGEVVEICPVALVHWDEIPRALQCIVFDWSYLTQGAATSAVAFGWGSFYNHANPANMRYSASAEEQSLSYIAARDIACGEELTINYNQTGGDIASSQDVWFQRTGIKCV